MASPDLEDRMEKNSDCNAFGEVGKCARQCSTVQYVNSVAARKVRLLIFRFERRFLTRIRLRIRTVLSLTQD